MRQEDSSDDQKGAAEHAVLLRATGAAALRTGGLALIAGAIFVVLAHSGVLAMWLRSTPNPDLGNQPDWFVIYAVAAPTVFGLFQLFTALVTTAIAFRGARYLVHGQRSLWPMAGALALVAQPASAWLGGFIVFQYFGTIAWGVLTPLAWCCAAVGLVSYIGTAADEPGDDLAVRSQAEGMQSVFVMLATGWLTLPHYGVQYGMVCFAISRLRQKRPFGGYSLDQVAFDLWHDWFIVAVFSTQAFVMLSALLIGCSFTTPVAQDVARGRSGPAKRLRKALFIGLVGAMLWSVLTLQFIGAMTWVALLFLASASWASTWDRMPFISRSVRQSTGGPPA